MAQLDFFLDRQTACLTVWDIQAVRVATAMIVQCVSAPLTSRARLFVLWRCTLSGLL